VHNNRATPPVVTETPKVRPDADPFAATVETCSRQSTCRALRHGAREGKALRDSLFRATSCTWQMHPVRARFSRPIRKLECDDHRSEFSSSLRLCFTSKPASSRACESELIEREKRARRRGERRKHRRCTMRAVNRQNDGNFEDSTSKSEMRNRTNRTRRQNRFKESFLSPCFPSASLLSCLSPPLSLSLSLSLSLFQ